MGMQRRWNAGGRRNILSVGLAIGFGIEFVVTNAECGLLVVGRIGRPMVGTGTCRARSARISVGRIFGGHLFIQPQPRAHWSSWRVLSTHHVDGCAATQRKGCGAPLAPPRIRASWLRGLVLRLHYMYIHKTGAKEIRGGWSKIEKYRILSPLYHLKVIETRNSSVKVPSSLIVFFLSYLV